MEYRNGAGASSAATSPEAGSPTESASSERDGAGVGGDASNSPDGRTPGSRERDGRPARTRSGVPSTRPALIVVGIAAGLVLLFGIGAALSGTSTASKPATPARISVKGTSLRARAATPALRAIERPGTPPSDVLRSLVVPASATTVSSTPWDGITQFSGSMHFRTTASQAAIVRFYKAELRARGWSISSVGGAHDQADATQVLAERASTDGWYWEVGIIVSPTSFSKSSAAQTTRFELELFEETDTT